MCDSKNKTVGPVSFTVGALLGAGAGFLLSTKKGRKYVKEAWKKVEPYVDDLREEVDDAKVKGRDAIDDALTSVKDFAEEKIPAKTRSTIKKTFFKGL